MTDTERRRYEEAKKAYAAFIPLYPFTLDNLPSEIWLPIPNYEGLYDCSNFGRVKSFQRGTVKIIKPRLDTDGYLSVRLSKNNKTKMFRINRLVGKLFIPNPDNKPQVDHVFAMKFDNYVDNLRWATSSENVKYSFESGLRKIPQGEDTYNAKLTNEQVLYIRENPDGLTQEQLAEMFGVNQSIISDIQLGMRYKNAGGIIRAAQKPGDYHKIPDEKRAQILADYQPGIRGHGYAAVGKRFGVSKRSVLNIVHESSK